MQVIDRVLFAIAFLIVLGLTFYNGRKINELCMDLREIEVLHSHTHHNYIMGGHNPPHVLPDYLPSLARTKADHECK